MYEAEVARGAEWLDANAPGWERKIDLGQLHMDDCAKCVLGQTFSDLTHYLSGYGVGIDLGADAVEMGFHVLGGDRAEYHALRDTWVALIKERFNTGSLSDAE